jgi:hypothetical protein
MAACIDINEGTLNGARETHGIDRGKPPMFE